MARKDQQNTEIQKNSSGSPCKENIQSGAEEFNMYMYMTNSLAMEVRLIEEIKIITILIIKKKI